VTAPVEEEEATTPHDPQCEAAVLGVLLRGDREPVVRARQALPNNWAWEPRHQRIWHVIEQQDEQGYGTDLYALLQADGLTPEDLAYAHTLVSEAPLPIQLDYYLKQAAKVARLRAADQAAMRMQRAIRHADVEALDLAAAQARDALDKLDHHTHLDDDDWAPVDLEAAIEGGEDVDPPNVLMRIDGQHLLYPGRVHSVSGTPGGGKSWLALVATAQCLLQDRTVVYIDYEDSAKGIVSRLLKLGVPADAIRQRFYYHRPIRGVDSPAKALLRAEHDQLLPALVVIDGVTEAMQSNGLVGQGDPNEKVATFYDLLPRYIARLAGEHQAGPAVLMIDHMAKNEDTRGDWPIGGQHKLAGLDGVAYVFKAITPFDRGSKGIAAVKITKDRPNQVGAAGTVIAELVLDERTEGELKWELRIPEEMPEGEDGQPRPTILMEAISRYLATHAGATKTQVCEAVSGQKQLKLRAIDCLVAEGYVSDVKRGRMSILTNLGHYRKEWDRGGQ
jgi:hypothetical protein